MIKIVREFIIHLSRNQKTILLVFTDILILNSIFIAAHILSANDFLYKAMETFSPILLEYLRFSLFQILLINAVSLSIISFLNGYRSFFRSSGVMNVVGTERIFGLITFCILLSVTSFSISQMI